MSSIVRGTGTTESERYLAKLADRTFLNLWSYPNVFIDKMTAGQGKELCDLLVVCGDHVLIFSDKTIEWPENSDINLAWARWYKRAIHKSVKQIRGAARWIREFPDRIFLDRKCQTRLPLQLPPESRMKLHGIVVARGAGAASREYYKGGTGSLVIEGHIQGDSHFVGDGVRPLAIGDVNPDGLFVHVLDDGSLDVVLGELDTITDLTDYLSKKEALVRSGQLAGAEGEEDLVAYFMTHMVSKYEHGFSRPDGSPMKTTDTIVIEQAYSDLRTNAQYIAKKEEDRISYLWDGLIEAFTKHMLAGTTLTPDGRPFDLGEHEQGVRYMALAPRFHRRNYGTGIAGALEKGQSEDRFVRAFIPSSEVPDSETGFFFMTLNVPDIELEEGYDRYRYVRHLMLEAYALSFLERYRYLKRIIGIATEPPATSGDERRGSSEDLVLAEAPEWTDELLNDLEKRKELYDIMKEGRIRQHGISGKEFPEVEAKQP